MSETLDITKLSAEQKQQLLEQVKQEEKQAKEKVKQDKKAFKELSAEYVERNINNLVDHNRMTEEIIDRLFEDYQSILDLKQSIYGNKQQDSHTSTLPDGSASITIGHNVTIGFDGTEANGVEKIKEFINSLSSDQENVKKLAAAVNTFLKPNAKTGMLNPSKIIELSKLKEQFNDNRFDEGLEIIFDAQIRRQNSMYVSGWKFITTKNGKAKKLEFRFTV